MFLKSFLGHLGLKDTKIDWQLIPEQFLIYFQSPQLNLEDIKSIMSRFQQFGIFINQIDYRQNEAQLYFGIRVDATFEYGLLGEEQNLPIGRFKLTKGIINWILTLDSLQQST
jgi:hypothetical protein